MPLRPHTIVIATFGSLGDLHPFLALATELRRRGHQVVIATARHYADKITGLGFAFQEIGPDVSPEDPELLHRLMRTTRGPEYLFRKVFLPHLPQLYADLERVTAGADLLIASEVVFAAPMLAEKIGIPWVSVLLSPLSFFSPHDFSVLPPFGWTESARGLPLALRRALLQLPIWAIRRWAVPLQDFRRQIGLVPMPDAILRGKLSAPLVLAMFSRHFAQPQPDWPAQTVQAGFAFFHQPAPAGDDAERKAEQAKLETFLEAGEPPLVFTLGSAAVHAPGDFFLTSAASAHRLKRRAVLLGGRADLRYLEHRDLIAVSYADHSRLFPRASGLVHQGGVGTTAEALRSGVPSLIVPFNFDQPDNAARAVRLGVAITLPRRKYNRRHSYYALHRLLRDEDLRSRARDLAAKIQQEPGAAAAADTIEGFLGRIPGS